MSDRYGYDKGSSRSTRDDSRSAAFDRERARNEGGSSRHVSTKSRSRSRSPRSRVSPDSRRTNRYASERQHHVDNEHRHHSRYGNEDEVEEVPAPPPPPRISKISMGFSKPKVAPIKMSLGSTSKSQVVPKPSVSSVFNTDDDEDEPEEMPAEARMRMRNIGRETPTSAGPNSFGKTKQGFCDAKKVFEKNLKQALESGEKAAMPKFPQTIYKIKGP